MFEDILQRINKFASDSSSTRSSYERLWAGNLLLMQGSFSNYSSTQSTVRRRNNSFYRLGWAARQEILAAVHTAYLKDEKTASIVAQNEMPFAAAQSAVFEVLFEMHIQYLRRYSNLLVNHIRAASNALDYGFCCGRFLVKPNIPAPQNIVYEIFPPDEVFLDWGKNEDSSRFAIFQHWYTPEELQAISTSFNFTNTEALSLTTQPSSMIRDLRMGHSTPSPIGGFSSTTVPFSSSEVFAVWECYFWMMLPNDVEPHPYLMFTTEDAMEFLTPPIRLAINRFPIIVGQMMLNPGVICGDSLAEIVRDPQETFNELMNARLDNLALVLRPTRLVNKDLGIDKYELARAAAGDLIEVEPGPPMGENIMTLETPDVTQGAFQEAANAADLIRSLAGLPDQGMGTSGTPEGVVSQVYQTAAKKIDFIIGTFAQTYWRPWHEILLDIIGAYDDNNAMELAIGCVQQSRPNQIPLEMIRNTLDINLGIILAHAAKQLPSDLEAYINLVQQAAAVNQQTLALVGNGVQDRASATLFNTAKLLEFAMDRAGVRGVKDFIMPMAPPPQQPPPPTKTVEGKQTQEQTQVIQGGQLIRTIQKTKNQIPVVQEVPTAPQQPQQGPPQQGPQQGPPQQGPPQQ